MTESGEISAGGLFSSDRGTPSSTIAGRLIDGRYRILRPIARGGMGVVCEATHESTGRTVAIKLLSILERKPVSGLEPDSESSEHSREISQRFHREARAAAALDTKHIIQILDTGTDAATREPFIVMELLRGEDVHGLLKRIHVASPDVAARVVVQACRALIKAHEADIIHRDIKPGNLFLAEMDDGEVVVKLLDFGIAKAKLQAEKDREQTDLTRTGSILGSPYYMSPEQAQGLKTIDARADIWSLGVVLYKMLCGRTPHHEAESTGQLLVLICTEDCESLLAQAPWVPPWLAKVVDRALRRKPTARYGTIQEMHDELLAGLGGQAVLHRDQLVPLPDEVRLAARLRAPLGEVATTLPSVGVGEEIETETSISAVVPDGVAALPDEVGTTQLTGSIPPGAARAITNRRRNRFALGAIAAAVVLLAVIGWRGLGGSDGADDGEQPVAASGEPPASGSAVRTVRLAISPADAQVTVDGAPAEVEDGHVELSGASGRALQVTVTLGARSVERMIAITDHGAVPSGVTLPSEPVAQPSASADSAADDRRPAGQPRGPRGAAHSSTAPKPASQPTSKATGPAPSTGQWNDQLAPSKSLD